MDYMFRFSIESSSGLQGVDRDIQTFTVLRDCAGGKIEKNEMGGACGAHGGGERCAQGFSGET